MTRSVADPIACARAEALFTSPLSATRRLTRAEVTAAVREAIRAHGGSRGCAAEVAAEYGEHPEVAAARMRWARRVVAVVYARRAGRWLVCAWSVFGQ